MGAVLREGFPVVRDREKQRVKPGGDGGHETEAREVHWVQGVQKVQQEKEIPGGRQQGELEGVVAAGRG